MKITVIQKVECNGNVVEKTASAEIEGTDPPIAETVASLIAGMLTSNLIGKPLVPHPNRCDDPPSQPPAVTRDIE